MTIAEALLEGGKTTVIGLVTVFAVLIILMLVIFIMKYIFYKDPKKSVEPKVVVKTEADIPNEADITPASEDISDDELIAVITAAVAASLNTSTYNLQIKSLRRIDNIKPAWNKAGVRDTISSRF